MKPTDFWDALSPIHAAIEDNYFDLSTARQMVGDLQQPILVVGAGQGLIVEELQKRGLACDGVDFSPEMVRQAKLRRGLDLVKADGAALPFNNEKYGTVIYATGVLDFNSDEKAIGNILIEGKRVLKRSGKMFAAFYRVSDASEQFLVRLGLLRDGVVSQRACLEMYFLNPAQMIGWVADRAGCSRLTATGLLLRMSVRGSLREKLLALKMQRIFKNCETANALVEASPETQPYRNERGIRQLFERLDITVRELRRFPTCWVAEIDHSDRAVCEVRENSAGVRHQH